MRRLSLEDHIEGEITGPQLVMPAMTRPHSGI